MHLSIALVGATGAVGQEILRLLEKRQFPVKTLKCFASPNSVGKTIVFKGEKIPVQILTRDAFENIDIAFFSAGKKISEIYVPIARDAGALAIDNSSFFRMHEEVPLIIPEINPHALKHHQGIIASPNCTTTIMLIALAPLHRIFGLKRIVAATYQAASGAGARAIQELLEETKAFLENKPYQRQVMPFPYAFNLFTHNSRPLNNGYVEEEMKVIQETRKILENQNIQITATCVRVPVLRAHSEALNVEFQSSFLLEEVLKVLKSAPGLSLLEDWKNNRFPMPLDASGQDDVFCGRVRMDLSQPNTLDLWVVGDQLLKGAALNVVQIAEELTNVSTHPERLF